MGEQTDRRFEVTTPLGEDVLLFRRMTTVEHLGQLFRLELDLLSKDGQLNPSDLLGQSVSVRVALPNDEERHFNGVVTSFAQSHGYGSFAAYHAILRPWFWFLAKTADCRIFQDKAVPDIIKEVLSDNGFTDVKDSLTGSYRTWDYCVQYRESDFNFVSRLMEQEGIYYHFKHDKDKHELVLCDSATSHEKTSGYEKLPFFSMDEHTGDREQEHVYAFRFSQRVQSGAYVLTDYDFEKPRSDLEVTADKSRPHEKADFEVFDYPGEYIETSDGDNYVRARLEELQAHFELVEGEANTRGLACGALFELTDFPRQDQNREYLVVSTNHTMQTNEYESGPEEALYSHSCTFTAIDSKTPYRSPRRTPKPVIHGPQTAVVVGKQGEEIFTDKYGRIKVQFHWDRYGESNENSSCWIRVAQTWAGKKWGTMYIPRIGQEVLVEFLEGDPDRPIVTGSIYNAEQMPHYNPETDKTKSYIKSNSSKGGEGHNELRFEDKAGEEQIYIHAERNMDCRVEKDSMEQICGNRHQIIGSEEGGEGGDQYELVHQDKHLNVKRDRVEHVEGNAKLMIGKGDADGGKLDVVVEKKETKSIGPDGQHVSVEGDCCQKIDGGLSQTIGMDHNEKAGMNYALEAGQAIHIKGGMTVVIEAGMQLTLKVGGSFVNLSPIGVDIQGVLVNINSGGAAGSGSGANPVEPGKPEEASPTEPEVADESEPGTKSCD